MTAVLLTFALLAASESSGSAQTITYGQRYLEDTGARELPKIHISGSYGTNITNSFLDLDSAILNLQIRVWKYISTGLLSQWIATDLSNAGSQVRQLEAADISVNIPTPKAALFSHTQLQLMLGKWNVLNLFPLDADLMIGGGFGAFQRIEDRNGREKTHLSYLWSAETRLRFHEIWGISTGLLGYRDSAFLHFGILFGFN